MIVVKIDKHTEFYSATYEGRLYFRLPIPFTVHSFTPIDIYKCMLLLVERYEEDKGTFLDEVYVEVVEIEYNKAKQYVVAREIPKPSTQQFKECCF